MKTNLPPNWISSNLGDVTSFLSRGISPKYVEQGGIEVINQKCIRDHRVNSRLSRRHDVNTKSVSEDKIVQMWDGLVNSTGVGTLGRVAQVTELLERTTVDSHVTIVRPKKGFFHEPFFGLLLRKIEQEIEQLGRGAVGQIELPRTQLSNLTVTYPESKTEQQKIVDKIEELFSVVETISNSLAYVKKATTNLGSKLLFDSFTGKLTKNWRDNNQVDETGTQLIKKYTQKVIVDNKNLPDTWAKVKIGDIFGVYVGSTPSRKEKSYWGGDIPWVSSGEVSFCRIKGTKETITQLGYDNSSTKIHPVGTVLLGMIGEGKTRGQVAILDIEATHNQNSAAIRVSETDVLPEYVYYFFQSEYQKTRQIGSGNNQKALNKTRISEIEIPIPPVEEQRIIVDLLETYFSNLEAIKNDLDLSERIKIQSLKQSILKQAFEGKLV